MTQKHLGPFEYAGTLADAAALVEDAWTLVRASFAEQQVAEFASALASGHRQRHVLHAWIPGFHWHRTHLGGNHTGPVPASVLMVVQDMLALKRIPGLLPEHAPEVARRIKREGERALVELRMAAQYAPAGIVAEWSAITDHAPSAPDVRIRACKAEIEVKRLDPREDIADDLFAVFGALDDALSQIERRLASENEGPRTIVVVLPGAKSLEGWNTSEVFRASMSLRLGTPDYEVVSAVLFVAEPIVEIRADGQQFYGAPVWHVINPTARWPWPDELPLVTNDA
jgi:hypothetical protein